MAINQGHVNLKDGLVVMLDAANPRSALSKKNGSNIYNRPLSESEIKQNFAAYRDRYSI